MTAYPKPEAVFRYFSEIAAIPHGSGNTAAIRAWCLQTAARLGIDAEADAAGNVILRKPASSGCETRPAVILQGHLDMVCAKLPDCIKNMETEEIELQWSAEYLSAKGTTLGGDDGIAIAYAFAILESQTIPHPPLTVILTVDEETGMDGAAALSPDALTGDMLINLDSEEEGVFTVGCAGGMRMHLTFPVQTQQCTGKRITLMLSGLQGGHSGTEIHRPLLNANTAMLRLLSAVRIPFHLCTWEGGIRDNAIPTECTVSFLCPACMTDDVLTPIFSERDALLAEYPAETELKLQMDLPVKSSGTALTADATAELLRTLRQIPNGVQEMNETLHMPETSLNLGIFRLHGGQMEVDALIRSGIDEKKHRLAERLRAAAENAGGTATASGSYPAWEYRADTALKQTASAVYRRIYGNEPIIQTIHAGLECGILAAKAPQLMCISIGPDILDIHTPRERLSIASTARTWEFLLELLASVGS